MIDKNDWQIRVIVRDFPIKFLKSGIIVIVYVDLRGKFLYVFAFAFVEISVTKWAVSILLKPFSNTGLTEKMLAHGFADADIRINVNQNFQTNGAP